MVLHGIFRHHLDLLDRGTERVLLFLELSNLLIETLVFGAAAQQDRNRQRQEKSFHRNFTPRSVFPYVTGVSGARAKIARWPRTHSARTKLGLRFSTKAF